VRPNLTSYVSGNHFLSPADFATIYDLNQLYSAGSDGSGQKIAVVGQSSVNLTDLSNFRSAAGLPAAVPTQIVVPSTTSTRCTGDEGESDLDLEWSGGVAKNAAIIFVIAGLSPGDVCGLNRQGVNVWDALSYAVQHNVAPFVSISYGFCEAGLGTAFAGPGGTLQTWAQQGQAQGQTIVSASGDAGAADCDGGTQSGTSGLAVDAPAVIPEVTGAGGTTFTGDAAGTVTGTAPNTTAGADLPYWSGSGTGSDTVSTALIYIPETAWNDTAVSIANNGPLSASGGGASAFFSKPSWQTGAGVPADGKRDVPDISISASPNHDGYLFCSEDGPNNTIIATCTAGFRDSSGSFAVVGGTSAAAPTFSGILALINAHVGNTPPAGLAPVNPTLYSLAASHASAFHDVTTGNNIVPCTAGTTGCPTSHQYGFNAGTGYDQVTGLGSVDAFTLAQAWPVSLPATTTALVAAPASINVGDTVTLTATVSPATATGNVNFFVGGTTSLGTIALNGSGVAVLTTTLLPAGTDSVTATYVGDSANAGSTSTAQTVTVTGPDFAIATNPTSSTVVAGHATTSITVTVTPNSLGFSSQITFSCTGLPTGATCAFNPATVTPGSAPATTALTISTVASTAIGLANVSVTGTGTGANHSATVALTVNTTDQSFSLAPTAASYPVSAGQQITATVNLTATNGFNSPVTYTCTDPASESTCTGPVGATTSTSLSFVITTTAPTARLDRPFDRGTKIFYAAMLPGLLGILFTAGSRKRSLRGMRMLGLIVVLGFSTMWLGSCGGSTSSTKNPGTPPGPYSVVVNATTGGANAVTATTTINLVVQ
jgi:subtilase family serine protease